MYGTRTQTLSLFCLHTYNAYENVSAISLALEIFATGKQTSSYAWDLLFCLDMYNKYKTSCTVFCISCFNNYMRPVLAQICVTLRCVCVFL